MDISYETVRNLEARIEQLETLFQTLVEELKQNKTLKSEKK